MPRYITGIVKHKLIWTDSQNEMQSPIEAPFSTFLKINTHISLTRFQTYLRIVCGFRELLYVTLRCMDYYINVPCKKFLKINGQHRTLVSEQLTISLLEVKPSCLQNCWNWFGWNHVKLLEAQTLPQKMYQSNIHLFAVDWCLSLEDVTEAP